MTETATATTAEPAALDKSAQADLEQALNRLPFRAHLSLEPLFRSLEQCVRDSANAHCAEMRPLLQKLMEVSALRGAIEDAAVVEEHRDSIHTLMSFVFPELTAGEVAGRAWAPFAPRAFFATEAYRQIFAQADVEFSSGTQNKNRDFFRENLHAAYWLVYRAHYAETFRGGEFTKRVRDKTTGLDRFFLLVYNYRFVDIDAFDFDVLPETEFRRLLLMDDLDELQRRMPLDNVTISGFCFQTYIEATETQNLSLLKTDLVEPDALTSPERFGDIQRRLRSLLQIPELEMGLALRYRKMAEQRYCTVRSVLKDFDGCTAGIEDTIYGEVVRSQQPLLIPDLVECDCDSAIVQHLRDQGVRSVCLLPLVDDGEVIGLLELSTRRSDELTTFTTKKLADLVPPLTVAVRRQQEEIISRAERTMKAHCTAIHPSVEWRFEDAAYRYDREMDANGSATFERISFEDVHPLYGAMDIRGSSNSRNRAIQSDLLEHLALARRTLNGIHAHHPIPIADYYDSVLEKYAASVTKGLNSGDEISVIEFLRTRIETFFRYIQEQVSLPQNDDGKTVIDLYFDRMDPQLGILYDKRKDYEDSVALINDTLGAYLDEEEAKAQAIFPHYFEKFKTDGIEHSIYVGQSMTRDEAFDEVQLRNLRLWQLRIMCEKARISASLLPKMKVPLETTPLVLAQSSPLTIQFSPDEKQFAVEGSYNIRYEIIKKRIDKSTIRGTSERLTQPGHLAVIFSHDKEHEEYRHYFTYLVDKGFLEPDVETLELDDLQGVHGLRALRAKVVLSAS